MGVSIIGIIIIQMIWINNALKVKNELFSHGVNEALIHTSKRLQKIQDLDVISDIVFHDSPQWTNEEITVDIDLHEDLPEDEHADHEEHIIKNQPKIVALGHNAVVQTINPKLIKKELKPISGNASISLYFEPDSNQNAVFKYHIKQFHDSSRQDVYVNSSSDDVIIIRKDSIIEVDSLLTRSFIHLDSFANNIDNSIIYTPDITTKARQKVWKIKESMNQFVSEITTFDLKKLDNKLVGDVLKEELENRNIPINFEYGVFIDTILTSHSEKADTLKLADSYFSTKLYPDDIIEKNIKLALYFPKRDSFIYKSVSWLLITSLVFSLFILMTFALSIFYILKQKKISEMKSDFINNMTHEFKTPIATISVAVDSISNDKVIDKPDKIKYFAGMIKKENIRMNRQVEDILTIARLDKEDFEFKWEAIDVHSLVKDAIQGIILQVEKRGGKVESELAATNPVITTDKIHCTNIVYNLLDNANKYSPNSPEIFVSSKNTQKGVLITVSDKGIGMSKVVQGKIFERFYRQSSGNIHNVKGFGLGLSYVKAVVEANKGTISVQSEPGKGSYFHVFLPFMRE